MLGFSVFLNKKLTVPEQKRIELMKSSGFEGIFTSLNIPEDNVSELLQRLKDLGGICKKLNFYLTVDVSIKGLNRLNIGIKDIYKLIDLGVTALRIDDGFSMEEVACLSNEMNIALNASTISDLDIKCLKDNHANFDNLEAWHNYYPRPETGLDNNWFIHKNEWLKKQGFTTMAFIASDTELRGPIFAGLPTLECDRYTNPLVATIKLLNDCNIDKVYVGDGTLSEKMCRKFEMFFSKNVLQLSIQSDAEFLYKSIWHNRPDISRDVVRLIEGRERNTEKIVPHETRTRLAGAITIDNCRYKRYCGELQIVKKQLNADTKVNVIGQVVASEVPLLQWIGSNQAIRFVKGD